MTASESSILGRSVISECKYFWSQKIIFVEDAVEDLEAQIINAYEIEPPPAARISHKVALDALETLTLYKLQTGTMDSSNSRHSIENNAERRVRKQREEANKGKGHWPEGKFRGIRIYICSDYYTCCYKNIFAIRIRVDRPNDMLVSRFYCIIGLG